MGARRLSHLLSCGLYLSPIEDDGNPWAASLPVLDGLATSSSNITDHNVVATVITFVGNTSLHKLTSCVCYYYSGRVKVDSDS